MGKALTKKEARDRFLEQARFISQHWANMANVTEKERCEGVIISMFSIFDGTSSGFPAFDLVIRPHPEDTEYHIKQGEDYYVDGQVINDNVHLHSLFYKSKRD